MTETSYFSRSEVMRAGEKAWAMDERFRQYAYDGSRFWRRRPHSIRYAIVDASKVPASGWMHAEGCDCHLCAAESPQVEQAA